MDEPKPINERDPANGMNDFESKLQQAFVRRPAPPGLKRRS